MPTLLDHRENLASWVREEPHRQGDGYLAAIYYFISKDQAAFKQGLDLINWSLAQAAALGGCGRHIVPTQDKAREQIAALTKYRCSLPKALRRIGSIVLKHKTSEQEFYDILFQVFLEEFTTLENVENSTKFIELNYDCKILADYFFLGSGTLKNALSLSET
jgi:hypothetical protein